MVCSMSDTLTRTRSVSPGALGSPSINSAVMRPIPSRGVGEGVAVGVGVSEGSGVGVGVAEGVAVGVTISRPCAEVSSKLKSMGWKSVPSAATRLLAGSLGS